MPRRRPSHRDLPRHARRRRHGARGVRQTTATGGSRLAPCASLSTSKQGSREVRKRTSTRSPLRSAPGDTMSNRHAKLGDQLGDQVGGGFLDVFADHWPSDLIEAALAQDPDVVYVHKTSDPAILRCLIESGLPVVRMVHYHDSDRQRIKDFPWNRSICTRWRLRLRDHLRSATQSQRAAADQICLAREEAGNQAVPEVPHATRADQLHEIRARATWVRSRIDPRPPGCPTTARRKEAELRLSGDPLRRPAAARQGRRLPAAGARHDPRDGTCSRVRVGDARSPGRTSSSAPARISPASSGSATASVSSGGCARAELAERYQRARLAIVPSVWPEPMGMVGLEFMPASAAGGAFDAGGISHWLEDGATGFLAVPKDVDGLARHIARLLEDPSLAEKMGRRARQVAELKSSRHDDIDRLLQILSEAATGTPPPPPPKCQASKPRPPEMSAARIPVTVVMRSYNDAALLPRTLAALDAQQGVELKLFVYESAEQR